VVEGSMSTENWPSSTECLRAWGWLEAKGRKSVRARDGTSGEVGASGVKISYPQEGLEC
jgi:hypothetical protein